MKALLTNRRTIIPWLGLALLVLASAGVSAPPVRVSAQGQPVQFVEYGFVSEFPEGIRFFAEIDTEAFVEDVRVSFVIGARRTTQYAYLELDSGSGPLVSGELFHRTDSPDRYVPPGSVVAYWLEVTDREGNVYLSDRREDLLYDARYDWESVTVDSVSVMYHGPVETRALRLAEAAAESLAVMGPVTGAETATPIVMMLYNNNAEMIGAVVPRSATISRELITEGQAFAEENVVLVLAGRNDIGTSTHEITHILVARAAGGSANMVPLWLNEGLAEFGNLDKTVSYDRYLEWAIDTNRLSPFRRLQRFPGDPNLTLVAYGQSRSMVEYMVETYGPASMAELLAGIGSGVSIDEATGSAYGLTLQELEDEWREDIGADPYIAPSPVPSPTPAVDPTPVFKPFTLTPVVGGVAVGEGGSARTATPATPTEKPTPTPEPLTAPEPSPALEEGTAPSAGACNVLGNRGDRPVEASTAAVLLALFGFAVFRTFSRRSA